MISIITLYLMITTLTKFNLVNLVNYLKPKYSNILDYGFGWEACKIQFINKTKF